MERKRGRKFRMFEAFYFKNQRICSHLTSCPQQQFWLSLTPSVSFIIWQIFQFLYNLPHLDHTAPCLQGPEFDDGPSRLPLFSIIAHVKSAHCQAKYCNMQMRIEEPLSYLPDKRASPVSMAICRWRHGILWEPGVEIRRVENA